MLSADDLKQHSCNIIPITTTWLCEIKQLNVLQVKRNSQQQNQCGLQYREIAGCCGCGFAGQVAGIALGGASGLLADCDTDMPACW